MICIMCVQFYIKWILENIFENHKNDVLHYLCFVVLILLLVGWLGNIESNEGILGI
jgi:hypothetical protein